MQRAILLEISNSHADGKQKVSTQSTNREQFPFGGVSINKTFFATVDMIQIFLHEINCQFDIIEQMTLTIQSDINGYAIIINIRFRAHVVEKIVKEN